MSDLYAAQLAAFCRSAGLPVPTTEHKFHPLRKWRFDFAWPEQMVAIEIDGGLWKAGGGRHNRAKGYEADCEKLNEAAAMGWRVLRVTTGQWKAGLAFGWIERALRGDDQPRGNRHGNQEGDETAA